LKYDKLKPFRKNKLIQLNVLAIIDSKRHVNERERVNFNGRNRTRPISPT